MKKAIALLVAVAAALSISIGVFAADNVNTVAWATDNTDQAPKISLETNQLVLGYSSGGGNIVVTPEIFLKPGNEYTYQIFRVQSGNASIAPNAVTLTPVTKAMLGSANLRVRSVKGSGNVVSAKINQKGSGNNATFNFVVETKETYGTKVNDLEYTIVVSGTPTSTLLGGNFLFKTGYRAMLDDDIDSYDEGDTVTIPNDRPVITKKQFETLAKNFNYKPITFTGEDGDWTFTGRVSGMGDANFLTTYDVVPDIINMYPDQDYKFLTFNAGITFPTNGEMRIDVSDLNTTNSTYYAYLYRNGALTPVNTTFDSTSDELVFRTNYLGAFVVTNKEITEANVTEPTEPAEPTTPNTNPPTGAADAMTAVITLGLASIVSAGFISKKNRKNK